MSIRNGKSPRHINTNWINIRENSDDGIIVIAH